MRQGQDDKGRLVAVVVTHQRRAKIAVTLAALLASPPQDLAALVVVDNASDDGTADLLAGQSDPRLTVLRLEENLGGAGGFALGMQHAMQHLAPDWLVVMDDDARPLASALATFHALDLRGFDGFAAAVRAPDGTLADMNRPTLNPFWHRTILLRALAGGGREAFHLGPADFARPGLRPVDGASFVGFFLRSQVIERHGYPDASLFVNGEDAFYTLGLTKAGCRLGFDPSVVFEHDTTTYSRHDPRIRPLWRLYYMQRNQVIIYRLATGVFLLPVLCLFLPRWLWRIRAHRGERLAFLRLLGLALLDGWRQRTDRPHAHIVALAAAGRPNG